MKRILLILALACLTSCGAARNQSMIPEGFGAVYFSDGKLISGPGIKKPRVEGCFVILETENAMRVIPFYRIWEVQWFLDEDEGKDLKPSHTPKPRRIVWEEGG